jgi:MFS family permease
MAAVLAAARVLRADAGRADPGKLDWVGAALLCPGLAGIVFGLSETEAQGAIGQPLVIAPFFGGIALTALFVVRSLRVASPLIDVRVFRSRGFAAAAATTTLLGAALFGAMLILPLYYQVDRGHSALTAGLLMAPQGLGAAAALPLSGRLTDRMGGGPVVLVGCIVATLATLPWVFVTSATPDALLGGVLFVRGIGMGCSVQPSMAAAYALLPPERLPGATAALNALRQIGGSIGTALLAVVLEHQAQAVLPAGAGGVGGVLQPLAPGARARVADPVAAAFGHTFAWAAAMTAVAALPGLALLRAERNGQRRLATGPGQPPAVRDQALATRVLRPDDS